MKMNFKYAFVALMMACAGFTSCSEDDDPNNQPDQQVAAADIEYWQANSTNWNNYMINVATLLTKDASRLYKEWNDEPDAYKTTFTTTSDAFPTYKDIIIQIIDGCVDIANEVGVAKIGDPYNLYKEGKTVQALYAVESWYSYHSRQDYKNNIYSIQNAFFGNLSDENGNVTAANKSIAKYVENRNAALYQKVKNAITDAADAIWAIPDPFRNHIGDPKVLVAMEKCAELTAVLDEDLRTFISANINEAEFQQIAAQYVSAVVLPTYQSLKEKTVTLNNAIRAFAANPSNAGFEKACEAWLDARAPWETSEAFLFGPVADLGLDPNMDSWPLDQDAIVNILKNGNFSALNWDGEYDEDDKAIETAQSVRGFHTLEFLLFKNGSPRKVAAE